MFRQCCRGNQNTHFLFNNFFSENDTIFLGNVEKYGRAGQTTGGSVVGCMHIACWMTRATDTHSEYVILIAFQRQQWLRERASVLCHMYITCHVICYLC